ncbi:hypothetical protein RclHR1_06410012 [Rhizophagus clarus]|uniref:Uncharacterized protein n=1 Tax=Rhizophagus clarus TaxID=94130 RepID=A0A2Z6S4J2_9GLOM|nr:hypothetical protein RclHR1_06410012 [Rhizophagus clarus]
MTPFKITQNCCVIFYFRKRITSKGQNVQGYLLDGLRLTLRRITQNCCVIFYFRKRITSKGQNVQGYLLDGLRLTLRVKS